MIEQQESPIVFKGQIVPQQLRRWGSTITSNNYISLTFGEWQKLMGKKYELIEEIRISQEFSLYGNYEPLILKQIQEIKFPFLQRLNVWANNIKSIEGLSRIYMPLLEEISLWNNEITNQETLRKCFWPNLKVLAANQNKNPQLKRWSEILATNLNRIDIQQRSPSENIDYPIFSCEFLFKMEASHFKAIVLSPINFQKKSQILKKKSSQNQVIIQII